MPTDPSPPAETPRQQLERFVASADPAALAEFWAEVEADPRGDDFDIQDLTRQNLAQHAAALGITGDTTPQQRYEWRVVGEDPTDISDCAARPALANTIIRAYGGRRQRRTITTTYGPWEDAPDA